MSSFANTKILTGLIESTQLMQASLRLFTPTDFDPTSTSQKDRQVQQSQQLQRELIRLIRDLQETCNNIFPGGKAVRGLVLVELIEYIFVQTNPGAVGIVARNHLFPGCDR